MRFVLAACCTLLLAALPPPVPPDSQLSPPPKPAPQPNPNQEKQDEAEPPDPAYMTMLPEDGSPWGLAPELASRLQAVAERYADYAVRFTSIETVRKAKFEGSEAKKETSKKYGYLLVRGGDQRIQEFRQKMKSDGTITANEVNDAEAFPPAYEWVFLFSKMNQPYFAYRERGDRFEGYDWVRVVEFKGAVPYTDGREIRQWDGVVL